MQKLRAYWVDLNVAVKEGEPPPEFRRWCDIVYCSDPDRIEELILDRAPAIDFICFDFDYPDRAGMRLLRSTKSAYPSLPCIMLTVQHSEALAIWAFRAKVFDYLVKPVSKKDAARCQVGLTRALHQRNAQTPRKATVQPGAIPDEVAYLPKSDEQILAPAIQYIEKNFRSCVRSETIAATCDLTPFRFSRLFKETFGLTFRDYLIKFRLREAYRLLANPRVNVADIAFAVGFNDPSYFSRIFKQRMGVAPSSLVGHANEVTEHETILDLPRIPS